MEYRDKYGMGVPSRTLARIMHHEHPLVFDTLEKARSVLRYLEGKGGHKKKDGTPMGAEANGNKYIMKEHRPYNPFNLPESYEEEQIKYKLPIGNNNILLLSDIHAPYHNIAALNVAMEVGLDRKINTIVINGDLIDNHYQSRFQADLRKRRPKEEFDITKGILRKLREVFPDAHIHWIKGNHDTRYEKWLMTNAGFLWEDNYFSLEERLRLHEEKVQIHDDRTIMEAGKLHIAHGHYLVNSTGPSAAKMLHDRTGGNFIMGHLHKRFSYQFRNADGETYRSYITGCLCEKYPNYNPQKSQSELGFAHITVQNSGDFDVMNLGIDGNKIIS